MISSRNQNQLPFFFTPLGDLLKALMFLSNLNSFNSFPSSTIQGFSQRKGSSKVWKEKGFKLFCHLFSFFPSCFCFCITCVFCFHVFSQSSFMLCFVFVQHVFGCFLFSFALFCFSYKNKNKKIEKSEKYKNSVCLCTLVLVYFRWPLKQNFLNIVSFVTQMSISMHN